MPGHYFQLLLVGYLAGIDAERGSAWRPAESLAVRSCVRRALHEAAPDHTISSRTRGLIDVETPTREDLARLDRTRRKTTSNQDWTHWHDPDAKVTKMRDSRTHLAHKAQQALDLETGAIVAVTLIRCPRATASPCIETVPA